MFFVWPQVLVRPGRGISVTFPVGKVGPRADAKRLETLAGAPPAGIAIHLIISMISCFIRGVCAGYGAPRR